MFLASQESLVRQVQAAHLGHEGAHGGEARDEDGPVEQRLAAEGAVISILQLDRGDADVSLHQLSERLLKQKAAAGSFCDARKATG